MTIPFEKYDRVMAAIGKEKGIVTHVDKMTKSFYVQWDAHPEGSATPYPESFAGKHIVSVEPDYKFKDKNNPNVVFKRRKLK